MSDNAAATNASASSQPARVGSSGNPGNSESNIVLIGMPASGKSTVGVVLAKIAGKSFIDLDISIQEHMGKTLQQIIDERGAEGFIQVENDVLGSVECSNTVLSTGGSAVYSDEAMRHLSQTGTVVYLKTPYEEIAERIGDLDVRGVVMRDESIATLRDLFEERAPLYDKYADVVVDVSGMHVGEAAIKVARTLGF